MNSVYSVMTLCGTEAQYYRLCQLPLQAGNEWALTVGGTPEHSNIRNQAEGRKKVQILTVNVPNQNKF